MSAGGARIATGRCGPGTGNAGIRCRGVWRRSRAARFMHAHWRCTTQAAAWSSPGCRTTRWWDGARSAARTWPRHGLKRTGCPSHRAGSGQPASVRTSAPQGRQWRGSRRARRHPGISRTRSGISWTRWATATGRHLPAGSACPSTRRQDGWLPVPSGSSRCCGCACSSACTRSSFCFAVVTCLLDQGRFGRRPVRDGGPPSTGTG